MWATGRVHSSALRTLKAMEDALLSWVPETLSAAAHHSCCSWMSKCLMGLVVFFKCHSCTKVKSVADWPGASLPPGSFCTCYTCSICLGPLPYKAVSRLTLHADTLHALIKARKNTCQERESAS